MDRAVARPERMTRTKLGVALALVCATALPDPSRAQERLTIGFREDAPPFVSRVDESEINAADAPGAAYRGFTADICRSIITALADGKDGGVEVSEYPVTAADRFEDAQGNQRAFDMLCDTTSITRERLDYCNFSFPYFVTGIAHASRKPDIALAETQQKSLGLVGGTTAVERLRSEWRLRFNASPHVEPFENYEAGMEALVSGKIEVLFGDQILLEQARETLDAQIFVSDEMLSTELYGLCINPERPDLLRVANATLAELYASGRIYTLVKNHFDGRGASRFLVMLYAFYAVPEN